VLKVTIERTEEDRSGEPGLVTQVFIADMDPTANVSDHTWWTIENGVDGLHGDYRSFDKRKSAWDLVLSVLCDIVTDADRIKEPHIRS
jgi:hypothetical protein